MKKLLLVILTAAACATPATAQIYRPSVVGQTTVLGAVAGALIGGHNHDRWAEGALIGAAAGAVVGAVVDDSRAQQVVYSQPTAVYSQPTVIGPAPVVADAPMIGAPAPQVVYVNPAPRVVYVEPAPIVVSRPVVYVSAGWGPRYYGYRHHGFYGHHGYGDRGYHGGHSHHGRH